MNGQDYSKLSDAELMALINQPQLPPPQSSQQAPMGPAMDAPQVAPQAAPIPVQAQPLPDISQPRDQPEPDFLDEMDKRVRALARGVPVAGAAADEGNALFNAAVSPYLEPLLKHTPFYDPKSAIGDLPTFGDRYDASINLQRFRDDQYDQANPTQSKVLQGVGTVAGSVAALPALAAGSAALPVEAGLLPRMAVGALEGATVGGGQGYASGNGGFEDPSRVQMGLQGAAIGGVTGGAAPAALAGGGALWRGTGAKVIDAMRGARAPVTVPQTEAEALAQALRQDGPALTPANDAAEIAAALRGEAPTMSRDAAEIIATRQGVPVTKVPASAEDDAYARIAQALKRQRQTPDEMIANVQSLGPRGMIADSGEAVRDLARAAANRPSGASDILKSALDTRQKGTLVGGEFTVRPSSGRILDQAAEGLGVDGKAYTSEIDSLLAGRKLAADPAYAKMRQAPPVDIGELRDFSGSQLFKDAYDRARAISEKEFVRMPDGTEKIVPLSPLSTDSAAPLKDIVAAAEKQYPGLKLDVSESNGVVKVSRIVVPKEQRSSGIGTDVMSKITDYADRKGLQSALTPDASFGGNVARLKKFYGDMGFVPNTGRARDLAISETMVRAPKPGAAQQGQNLDWRTLDLMKQGLDDLVKEGKVSGIGANDQGATKGYLKRFVDKLDALNPDYKAARDAFAGPTAMKDAVEAGRAALREDAPELAKTMADLSPSEQQMYRLGALQGLKDKLGGADVTYDAARQAGVLKPNQLERFKELFPDKAAFAKFADMLNAEQTMFQTRGAVLGNSSTAKQLANMADQDESVMQTVVQGGVDAKTGNVMGLVRALGKIGGPAKLSEPTAEALASILSNMDQAALPQVAQRLTEAQKRQILADTLRQSAGVGGASAAAGSQPVK